ncbi:MAG: hypothetical protein KA059_08825 [Elusimicrobiales bacterium]|nr:hypothetical protein [Elusimicrobiales bacterium]
MKKIFIFIIFIFNFCYLRADIPELVSEIALTNNNIGNVWNGYGIDVPIFLYFSIPQELYLIKKSTVEVKGFKYVGRDEGYSIFLKHTEIKVNGLDMKYNYNGTSGIIYNVDGMHQYSEILETIFHEYFHSFQEKFFKNGNEFYNYIPMDNKNTFYFIYELHYLRLALISSGREKEEYIKRFIFLRNYRYSKLSEKQILYERWKERIEGSAYYLQLATIMADDKNYYRSVPISLLDNTPYYDCNKNENDYYISGALQMYILDSIRTPWKERLTNGESIFYILKDHFTDIPHYSLKNITKEEDIKEFTEYFGDVKKCSKTDGKTIIEKFKKSNKIVIKLSNKIKDDGPRPYGEWFKNGNENIFTNAELNLDSSGTKIEIHSELLSWGIKENKNGKEIYSKGYAVVVNNFNDTEINIDDKQIDINNIKSPLRFKKIDMESFYGNQIILNSKCPGIISRNEKEIRIDLECKK